VPYASAAVRTAKGHWCATSGRVVGTAVGDVDGVLGTFDAYTAARVTAGCTEDGPPDRSAPLRFGYGGGSGDEPFDITGRRGRIERRALRGEFRIDGVAAPDVVRIIVATPRDVRTLVPGPSAHAFLAIYDGDFPTGAITLTSVLRDGTRQTETIVRP
jgi:hypothetical protein